MCQGKTFNVPGKPDLPQKCGDWAPKMATKTSQSRYSSKLGSQNDGIWGALDPLKACLFEHMRNFGFDQHYHTKPRFWGVLEATF